MRKPKTEAEKQRASATMKAQWQEIRGMRKQLGVSLSKVQAKYSELRVAGLIDSVIAGDATAIRDAKEILDGVLPLFKEVVVKEQTNNIPGLNDIKIMLWAIEKIGSVTSARAAFAKAVEAVDG